MDDVHTETEVRRLLTTAADTIPADADLLGGVRRRRARHRRRAQAALAASSAAAVAAGALAAVTATSAPSALAAVISAAAKTSAGSYRISMTYTVPHNGTVINPPLPSGPQQVTGEFDPARHIGDETTSDGSQYRYIGHYTYWKPSDLFSTRFKGLLTLSKDPQVTPDKPWIKASAGPDWPADAISELIQSSIRGHLGYTVTSQDLLTLLKSVSTVRDEGAASGPGWTGTKYSFSETLAKNITIHGTVYVDQQGQVREMVMPRAAGTAPTQIGSVASDVTFSDFGVRVSVTSPPASQVSDGNFVGYWGG